MVVYSDMRNYAIGFVAAMVIAGTVFGFALQGSKPSELKLANTPSGIEILPPETKATSYIWKIIPDASAWYSIQEVHVDSSVNYSMMSPGYQNEP